MDFAITSQLATHWLRNERFVFAGGAVDGFGVCVGVLRSQVCDAGGTLLLLAADEPEGEEQQGDDGDDADYDAGDGAGGEA